MNYIKQNISNGIVIARKELWRIDRDDNINDIIGRLDNTIALLVEMKKYIITKEKLRATPFSESGPKSNETKSYSETRTA